MAASQKKNLHITLDAVQLVATDIPAAAKEAHRHIVTATLLWPRTSVSRKTSAIACTLSKLTLAPDPDDREWAERILFKEPVEERFGVEVTVSAPVSESQAAAFVRYAASATMGLVADAVEDVSPLAKFAAIPFNYAQKQLAKDETPALVATGVVSLLPSELKAAGTIRIPLAAPRDIVKTSRSRTSVTKGGAQTKRTVLLAKDEPNGWVELRYRVY